jgi:3'-5' exoribonuclease
VPIAQLNTGQSTDALYLVADRSLRAHKNKPGQYLQLLLQDRTGTIRAMYWDVPQAVAESVRSGAVYQVQGKVETYMDDLQIRVVGIRAPAEAIDWGQFLPESKRTAEELTAEFDALRERIEDPHYRALVDGLRQHPRIWPRFLQAPAATLIHHAYLRGLIEHTLNVCRLGLHLVELYPETDRDLLLAGAVFHDIGKAYEYERGPTFQRTTYGELVGHLAIGDNLVVQLAQEVEGMAPGKVWQLRHLVLSHHGQIEYGSPVLPKTLEGLLLHFADNIDAKVGTFRQTADITAEGESWTDKVFSMDYRRFYLPSRERPESDAPGTG